MSIYLRILANDQLRKEKKIITTVQFNVEIRPRQGRNQQTALGAALFFLEIVTDSS